jgi:hypothetical protein
MRLMRVCGPLLLWTSLLAVPLVAAAAEPSELARARNALKNLGYSEARTLLEAALNQGGHSRAELLEIYALRGEVEAVLDGPEASEREFRKLLVLDPQHPPPERETPTFLVPFANARKWVLAAGSLRVEHTVPMVPSDARSFDLVERIVSDPLAMVAGTEVFYRASDATSYTRLSTVELRQRIPVSPIGARYYILFVDRAGNCLVTVGTVAAPLYVATPPMPAPIVHAVSRPRERWYASRAAWALIGIGVAGLVGASVLWAESADAVATARSAGTRDQYLAARDRSIGFDAGGGALDGVGGALVIVGVAVLIHRAVRAHAPAASAAHASLAGPIAQGAD